MSDTTQEAQGLAQSFYEQSAGEGFDGMGADQFAIPLLLIAQPTSDIITGGDGEKLGIKAGDFYNSITKKCYGNKVKVVVAYFKVMWFEWAPNMGGLKGRHEPGSVPIKGDPFTGMTRLDNGNDIVETWLYFCILADHPEEGFMTYQSTRGNISYLKLWNNLMHTAKLPPTDKYPQGAPAPLYSQVWQVETKRNKNDKGTWFAFGEDKKNLAITNAGTAPVAFFQNYVSPVRQIAPTSINRIDVIAIEDKTEEASKY